MVTSRLLEHFHDSMFFTSQQANNTITESMNRLGNYNCIGCATFVQGQVTFPHTMVYLISTVTFYLYKPDRTSKSALIVFLAMT